MTAFRVARDPLEAAREYGGVGGPHWAVRQHEGRVRQAGGRVRVVLVGQDKHNPDDVSTDPTAAISRYGTTGGTC